MGQVSEEERTSLEELYAANEDLLLELISLENDLVDAYANGRLSQAERESFRSYYLTTPARHARTEFAKALVNHVANTAEGRIYGPQDRWSTWLLPRSRIPTPRLQLLYVAAFMAFLICGFGGLFTYRHFFEHAPSERDHELRLNQPQQTLSKKEIPDSRRAAVVTTERERELGRTPPRSSIASLSLTSHSFRGENQHNSLFLAPGVSLVRIRLVLERNDYSRYDVFLRTAEGRQLWDKKNIQSQPLSKDGSMIQLELPSVILRPGVYVLRLAGKTADGTFDDVPAYSFSITQQP